MKFRSNLWMAVQGPPGAAGLTGPVGPEGPKVPLRVRAFVKNWILCIWNNADDKLVSQTEGLKGRYWTPRSTGATGHWRSGQPGTTLMHVHSSAPRVQWHWYNVLYKLCWTTTGKRRTPGFAGTPRKWREACELSALSIIQIKRPARISHLVFPRMHMKHKRKKKTGKSLKK